MYPATDAQAHVVKKIEPGNFPTGRGDRGAAQRNDTNRNCEGQKYGVVRTQSLYRIFANQCI